MTKIACYGKGSVQRRKSWRWVINDIHVPINSDLFWNIKAQELIDKNLMTKSSLNGSEVKLLPEIEEDKVD